MSRLILKMGILSLCFIVGIIIGRYSVTGFKSKEDLGHYAEIMAYEKFNEGNITEALKYFEVSKHYNPLNMAPYIGIGTIFYNLELYDLALKEFETGVTKKNTNSLFYGDDIDKFTVRAKFFAYCYMGDIYKKLSNIDESRMVYERAAEVGPEMYEYLIISIRTKLEKESITKQEYRTTKLYLIFLRGMNEAGLLPKDSINKLLDFEKKIDKIKVI